MFVENVMTSDPVTVVEGDFLSVAESLIARGHFHQLAVLDDSGRLVGIITDRDIRSAVGFDATLPEKLRVGEVMVADPVTIDASGTLDEALNVFCEASFNALPVLRNKQLAGIVTRHDALSAFRRMLGLDSDSVRIEVALPNGLEDVVLAFDTLRSYRSNLVSAIVSRMRRDGDEPMLYLRIASNDRRVAEEHLRQAGLVVLIPEHD